jgi:hypothetical protein
VAVAHFCLVRPVTRRLASWIAIAACFLITALSLLIVGTSGKQIAKNRLVLADMQDRVSAIEGFQSREGRLPTAGELASMSQTLPVRYLQYDYELQTRPGGGIDSDYPQGWPASGGWILSFWRGEWTEYYSSWDRHYTLADQLSWWAFSWPGVVGFGIAAGLLLLCRSPLLRGPKQV